MLPAVEELVHRYRLLTEAIEEERPAVVFGCGNGNAAGLVHSAMIAFRSARPGATFRISARPAIVRVEGVANGSLDMACVRLSEEEIYDVAHRPLYVEELLDDQLILAAGPALDGFAEFQSLTERAIAPKALTRFPMILPEADTGVRRDFDRRCRDAGVLDRLKIVAEVGPWNTNIAYVRDGVGVGVVPRSATADNGDLVTKALPPKLTPPNVIRVICRRRSGSEDLDLSDGAVDFLDALRAAAKRRGSDQ